MDQQVITLLASILIPLGFVALRRLTRERPHPREPAGFVVSTGTHAACQAQVDTLADAGVAAWIEPHSEGAAVLVDPDQAPEIPALLRAPREKNPDAPLSPGAGADTRAP
ncbi:MAG: hypothetical protein PF961_09550 [Planctomycetota bacterium]|jgi:hypothetical protein|nr:hypothetical protein [Planctomycetota bacterium]